MAVRKLKGDEGSRIPNTILGYISVMWAYIKYPPTRDDYDDSDEDDVTRFLGFRPKPNSSVQYIRSLPRYVLQRVHFRKSNRGAIQLPPNSRRQWHRISNSSEFPGLFWTTRIRTSTTTITMASTKPLQRRVIRSRCFYLLALHVRGPTAIVYNDLHQTQYVPCLIS